METMRPVDAVELLEHLHVCAQNGRGMSNLYDIRDIINYVENMTTIEPEPKTCEGCIWEDDYNNGPCQYCNRAQEDWYAEKT